MNTKNDGGSVFPHDGVFHPSPGAQDPRTGSTSPGSSGMPLRDYFAAAAITGLAANPELEKAWMASSKVVDFPVGCAAAAYDFADAMIARRDK